MQVNWDQMMKKMQEQESKPTNKKDFKDKEIDPNIYVPNYDKTKNEDGSFKTTTKTLRFLSLVKNGQIVTDSFHFVEKAQHAFQANSMWYIENCPQHGKGKNWKDTPCPVCDYNFKNWKTDETGCKNRKKDVKVFSNVLIKKDAMNPELEGQVKIYQYKTTIAKKLLEAMKDRVDDETDETIKGFFAWNPEAAPDFLLRIKSKEIPNGINGAYIAPTFDLSGFKKEYSKVDLNVVKPLDLSYLVDGIFKPFEQLQDRFNKVMCIGSSSKVFDMGKIQEKPMDTVKEDDDAIDAPPIPESEDDDEFMKRISEE